MYIYEKSELAEHPMFEQAVILSEMTTGARWSSLYRDRDGEMAITFDGALEESQIKTILMHFKDLIDGDTDVPSISCKPNVDYVICNRHHADNRGEYTQIFTPDGYDYSRF